MSDKYKGGPSLYKTGRLNLKFLGRILWVMLLGDLLLSLLLFGWTLTWAESRARTLLEARETLSGAEGEILYAGGIFTMRVCTDPPKGGLVVPGFVQGWMPMNRSDVSRRVDFASGWFFPPWPAGGVYSIWVPDAGVEIVCDTASALNSLRTVFHILFGFQLFWFLMSIRKGARSIRRTLNPLFGIIEQARTFSAQPEAKRVDDLAGALYDIDGRRLHQRIPEAETPEELRPLAAAINAMLDRISAAHESQARFVSDASHELRTPIAVIAGYVNLLDRWGKEDPSVRQESIDALKSETRGMAEMVEQLLFLARGDSESIPLSAESVDLGELCRELARDMQVAYPDCSVAVKPSAATAMADRTLTKQALRILLDNAVRHGGGQSVTLASGTGESGTVWASVSDSGAGIDPRDMPHIFDRFYRSDTSRDRKSGGAGLGLPIARWIALRHGGQLTAVSRLGIGTRMTLTLPGQN